jgi:hypothetical protein
MSKSRPRQDQLKRYRSKVVRRGKNQCWHWRDSKDDKGYARFYVNDPPDSNYLRSIPAHRFTYALYNGAIPADTVIVHTCESRDCQNPLHLKPVDRTVPNTRAYRKQTHCVNGHEYTEANTTYHSVSGARLCRTCARKATLRSQHKRLAEQSPTGEYTPRHYIRRKPLGYQVA